MRTRTRYLRFYSDGIWCGWGRFEEIDELVRSWILIRLIMTYFHLKLSFPTAILSSSSKPNCLLVFGAASACVVTDRTHILSNGSVKCVVLGMADINIGLLPSGRFLSESLTPGMGALKDTCVLLSMVHYFSLFRCSLVDAMIVLLVRHRPLPFIAPGEEPGVQGRGGSGRDGEVRIQRVAGNLTGLVSAIAGWKHFLAMYKAARLARW